MVSNEESYYLNPKLESQLGAVRNDIKLREEFLNQVSVTVEDPVAINQDNYLPLQAFRLCVRYKQESLLTVSRRYVVANPVSTTLFG